MRSLAPPPKVNPSVIRAVVALLPLSPHPLRNESRESAYAADPTRPSRIRHVHARRSGGPTQRPVSSTPSRGGYARDASGPPHPAARASGAPTHVSRHAAARRTSSSSSGPCAQSSIRTSYAAIVAQSGEHVHLLVARREDDDAAVERRGDGRHGVGAVDAHRPLIGLDTAATRA